MSDTKAQIALRKIASNINAAYEPTNEELRQEILDLIKEHPDRGPGALASEIIGTAAPAAAGAALVAPSVANKLFNGRVSEDELIAAGIGTGTLGIPILAAIAARMGKPRTQEEQKAYDKSTLRKVLNLIPGVGAYNSAKSEQYFAEEAKRRIRERRSKQ